jgi:Fe-S-cluster containining protein
MLNVLQNKESICGGCKPRTCCYYYKVSPSGYDVFRIASALDIRPAQFLTLAEVPAAASNDAPQAGDGGLTEWFILDTSERRFELALAKTADPRRYGGCTFLITTNGGVHRCGLGELKPAVCAVYPSVVRDELVHVQNNENACWRRWSVAELDVDAERERHRESERRLAEYRQVVAEWNAKVRAQCARAGGEYARSFQDFCNYLENAYVVRYAA